MVDAAKEMGDAETQVLRHSDGTPLRALIVEDEAVVALGLEMSLEEMGAETIGAVRNGYAAVALAERQRPDVVLMDVSLDGDMDGIEAARIIRERFQIPVIFVTGMDNPVTELRVAEMGGAELLHKPANQQKLAPAIRRACLKPH